MQREDENIVKSLFIGMLFDNFEHNDEKTESKLLQIILVNDQTSQGMTWPVLKGFSNTTTAVAFIRS